MKRIVAMEISQRNDVLGSWALLPIDYVEFNPLSFCQGLESVTTDCRMMDKHVVRAVIRGDETKALGFVEPFDRTSHSASEC